MDTNKNIAQTAKQIADRLRNELDGKSETDLKQSWLVIDANKRAKEIALPVRTIAKRLKVEKSDMGRQLTEDCKVFIDFCVSAKKGLEETNIEHRSLKQYLHYISVCGKDLIETMDIIYNACEEESKPNSVSSLLEQSRINEPLSLTDFMERYCEIPEHEIKFKKTYLKQRKKALLGAVRQNKATMPCPENGPSRGQSYKYKAGDLLELWPNLQKIVSLPSLKKNN